MAFLFSDGLALFAVSRTQFEYMQNTNEYQLHRKEYNPRYIQHNVACPKTNRKVGESVIERKNGYGSSTRYAQRGYWLMA